MLIDIKPDNTKSLVKPPMSTRLKLGCVELAPGAEIGTHCTYGKEEIITVLKGVATLIDSGKEVEVRAGQAYFIGKGVEHNVMNKSSEPIVYTYTVALL